jgi:hypothetical protein
MGDIIVTQPWSSGQVVTPTGLNEFLSTAKIAPGAIRESQLAMAPAPFGYLSGLTLSIVPNSPKAIQINVGLARDDKDEVSMKLAAPLIKQVDSLWSAGTDKGALDAGSAANNMWYHVFLIYKEKGPVDVVFSTWATLPSLPFGFTHKRRIGSILTDASGHIVHFLQFQDIFYFKRPIRDVASGPQAEHSMHVWNLTTPKGIKVQPMLSIHTNGHVATLPGEDVYLNLRPSVTPHHYASTFGYNVSEINMTLWTNENQQIAAIHDHTSKPSDYVAIWTHGWIDLRGK